MFELLPTSLRVCSILQWEVLLSDKRPIIAPINFYFCISFFILIFVVSNGKKTESNNDKYSISVFSSFFLTQNLYCFCLVYFFLYLRGFFFHFHIFEYFYSVVFSFVLILPCSNFKKLLVSVIFFFSSFISWHYLFTLRLLSLFLKF